MNAPAIFAFGNSQVRTFADDQQNPWFLANDVCEILGYANPRRTISLHCKEGGVTKRYTPTEGSEQEMTYINEGNLYRLIVKSRKPEAERFEVWVMEEVLPTIRKTGGYSLTIEKTPMEGQLYQAVCAKTAGDGNARHWLWGRLNAHFALSSYKNLPVTQFDAAMQFVGSIAIPPVQPLALAAPEPRRETPEELITRWFEPNSYMFEPEFLARLGQACFARLHNQLNYHRTRADGKQPLLRWATPVPDAPNDNPLKISH